MNRHVHGALGYNGVKSLPATQVNVDLTKNTGFLSKSVPGNETVNCLTHAIQSLAEIG
jgi:hypothetical protein